jgi:alkylated DNA repair dioxygenase AlkB
MPAERKSVIRRSRRNNEPLTVFGKDSEQKKPPRARQAIPNDEPNPILKQVADPALESYKVDMPDASVYYIPDLIDENISHQWYTELANLSTWYRPTLKVYGKSVLQSRQIAAYANDPGLIVKYSGALVQLHTEYPKVLSSIQRVVEQKLGVQFNHVMLNRYDTGDVYIGLHRDNLENRVIATVSLGVERTFIMRHRPAKGNNGTRQWKLGNGSMFVMQGDTQRFWKHEIPKELKIKEGRISLTFRQLVF